MGVYQPNPTVQTVDNATKVTNVKDIKVSNGDLTVSGRTATINTDGSGIATLTATYVGYGSASNELTGESSFTYDTSTNLLKLKTVGTDTDPEFMIERNATQYMTLQANYSTGGGRLAMYSPSTNAKNFTFVCNSDDVVASGGLGFSWSLNDQTTNANVFSIEHDPGATGANGGNFWINKDHEDMNFRYDGITTNELFGIDAAEEQFEFRGNVYMNYAYNAARLFTVYGDSSSNFMQYSASNNRLEIRRQTDDDGASLYLFSGNSDGTKQSPLVEFYARGANDDGDLTGEIKFTGRNNADSQTIDYATIRSGISEANSNYGGKLIFETIMNGSQTEYMKLFDDSGVGRIVINEGGKNLSIRAEGQDGGTSTNLNRQKLFTTNAFHNSVGFGDDGQSDAGVYILTKGVEDSLLISTTDTTGTNSAPDVNLYRPVNTDDRYLGALRFSADTTSSTKVAYGEIRSYITNPAGSCLMNFLVNRSGSGVLEVMRIRETGLDVNAAQYNWCDTKIRSDDKIIVTVDAGENRLSTDYKVTTYGNTSPTLASAACYGDRFYMTNTNAHTITLPAGKEGMHLEIIKGGSGTVTVQPDSSDDMNDLSSGSGVTMSTNWDLMLLRCVAGDGVPGGNQWVAVVTNASG